MFGASVMPTFAKLEFTPQWAYFKTYSQLNEYIMESTASIAN